MKKKLFTDIFFVFVGGLIWAVSINTFTMPNLIAPGGFAGIATIIHHFFNLPIGMVTIVLNIPLFAFSIKKLGFKFIIKTIATILITSFIIDISAMFLPQFTEDKLLAALFGGILGGLGLGLIYMRGVVTGGTDLLARLIADKLPLFSYGRLIVILDAVVVAVAAIAFRDWWSALYATITIYIVGVMIDKLLEGLSTGRLIYIISEKQQEIANEIMHTLGRGATALAGKGCYTGNERNVIMVVVRRYELPKLKEMVKKIDNKAFVIVGEVSEIVGEGF